MGGVWQPAVEDCSVVDNHDLIGFQLEEKLVLTVLHETLKELVARNKRLVNRQHVPVAPTPPDTHMIIAKMFEDSETLLDEVG